MAADHGAIQGISNWALFGSSGIFAFGCAILKYGPAFPSHKKGDFCEEHHHISKTVEGIDGKMDKLYDKVNQVALELEHVKACLEK